jgi:integrase
MSARRTKVANRRGIYYRLDRDDRRVYEFDYYDSAGRRRWQSVAGTLKEAEAAREELRRHRRKGETIAPARAPRFAVFADEWLAKKKTKVRSRTFEKYDDNLRLHVKPRLGGLKVSEVREDDVAGLVRAMEAQGYAGATIKGALVPLSGVLDAVVRNGWLGSNPVSRLDRSERPKVKRKVMRVLDTDEIGRLLDASPERYRPLLATAAFGGLRLAELLGLLWADVDSAGGLLHVRRQFDRGNRRAELKTDHSARSVMLIPALATVLRQHRLASPFSGEDDPVFASTAGTPFGWRNVERRGMDKAVENAKLDAVPGRRRPTLHDLRDTYASLLIATGLDVVFVSRQLGHADPTVTLRIYADLFDRARHADTARAALEASYGTILERSGSSHVSPPVSVAGVKRLG